MDTQIPQFVTHLDGEAVARASEYRNQITYLHAKVEQAERAQEDAETAQYRAEEKAQAEADRADGAEAQVRKLLAAPVLLAAENAGIDPYQLNEHDMDAICDALVDAMDRGVAVPDLPFEQYVRDWEDDRG